MVDGRSNTHRSVIPLSPRRFPIINARIEQWILSAYAGAAMLISRNVRLEMFRNINRATAAHIYGIIRATKFLTSSAIVQIETVYRRAAHPAQELQKAVRDFGSRAHQ